MEGGGDEDLEPPGEEEVIVLPVSLPTAHTQTQEVITLEDKENTSDSLVDEEEVEDVGDDIVVEREIRMDSSGHVIVNEESELKPSDEEDKASSDLVIENVETVKCDNVPIFDQKKIKEGNSAHESDRKETDETLDDKSRRKRRESHYKSRSRSRSRSRSKRLHIDENLDDYVVVDSTDMERIDSSGEGDEEDILEIEVIKSNLALSEEKNRRRSRSRSNNRSGSRRTRSRCGTGRTRSRSRSRGRYRELSRDRRHPHPDHSRRDKYSRRREDTYIARRHNRETERRRDQEWRDKSEAFLARLGVSSSGREGRGFHNPPPLPIYNPHTAPHNTGHTVGDSRAYTAPPPPPTISEYRPTGEASSSSVGGYTTVDVVDAQIGARLEESYSRGVTNTCHRDKTQCVGQDIDFRFAESLRPGNYLLATWDIITVGGGLESSIYQLGCHTNHGDSLLKCILPEEESQREEARDHPVFPLIELSGSFFVRHPRLGQFVSCVGEKQALQAMFAFLDTGRNRVRPAYDGVVLMSHLPECIPQLFKSIKRWNLYNQFKRSVASLGDCVSYIGDCHSHRFVDSPSDQLNISLESAYERVMGGNIKSPMCETRSSMCHQILDKLLDGPANHTNLFAKYSHPLLSKKVAEWRDYRTLRERQEMFRPLRRHITEELSAQRVDLLTSGIYAASESEEQQQMSEEQVVAGAMCRLLISAGFDFCRLLNQARNDMDELELELRTTLLDGMQGQTRAVVDQTVRATRLVIGYLRMNGHRELEEVMKESRQFDSLELRLTLEMTSLKSERAKERAFKDLGGLKTYMESHSMEDAVVDATLRCLIQVGFSFYQIQKFYNEEKKEGDSWNFQGFRQYITKRLMPIRLHCGAQLNIQAIVSVIVSYFGTNPSPPLIPEMEIRSTSGCGARTAPSWYVCTFCNRLGQHWMVDCPMGKGHFHNVDPGVMEESYLKDDLAKVDAAIRARGSECAAVTSSLLAVNRYILNKISMEIMSLRGTEEQAKMVADVSHRVLALVRLSHFSLKNVYDAGERNFVMMLRNKLVGLEHLLPHGVGSETLVNWVTEYFRDNFSITNSNGPGRIFVV